MYMSLYSYGALVQFDAIGFVRRFLPHLLISLTGMVRDWIREYGSIERFGY